MGAQLLNDRGRKGRVTLKVTTKRKNGILRRLWRVCSTNKKDLLNRKSWPQKEIHRHFRTELTASDRGSSVTCFLPLSRGTLIDEPSGLNLAILDKAFLRKSSRVQEGWIAPGGP